MSHIHIPGVRQAQKRKTRQALLDAALELLEGQSLSSLGLREVTRAVGIAPTAFYRHFRSIEDLGVALVEEALGSLHPMIRTTVETTGDGEERIARALELIAGHVDAYPAHVRFVTRERHGGVRVVREAIRDQLGRFTVEVGEALASDPVSAGWSAEDVGMLAQLYVDLMLGTASLFLEASGDETGEARERVARVAARQMRLIGIGREHWLDRPGGGG
ncbi:MULTISPECIES: TetR family transcriptional regulator [unclassified Streptomyces]|uniref:TetR family transcriptional regulator n=1 Tax=unclassified Streptomyces TaxID=2593676 RepID=UPI000F6E8460|nr:MULTISPECIES: TetR family transcriptional regulator [unclassified Streptomyces]AZM59905.1 TetR family transcriptional regulator [Streptomyces sp. WAC 01438]RSM95011.1 TetR family transcriptional regulator [Streptomyces sp. WAC 01420]